MQRRLALRELPQSTVAKVQVMLSGFSHALRIKPNAMQKVRARSSLHSRGLERMLQHLLVGVVVASADPALCVAPQQLQIARKKGAGIVRKECSAVRG